MIYYLCHNKMSGRVSAVRHFVMRRIQSQRFKLNAIVNNRGTLFTAICVSISEQRCSSASARGSEKCWGLSWRPLWIFHVPNTNILVNFGTLSDDHSRFWFFFFPHFFLIFSHPVQMSFCAMMMNWRGGVWRSFSILCHNGRAVMEEPWIFTLQTVRFPFWCICVSDHEIKISLNKVCFFFVSFFFVKKGNFQPQSIVKSLVPSLNTLVLFEVSPVSFHQVRGTAPFHRSCTSGCRTLRTCCVCQGLRGFGRGQVSSVAERVVSWPVHRTSSTLRGGLHPKKPPHTQRCKPDQQPQQKQYLRFMSSKQLLLLTKT